MKLFETYTGIPKKAQGCVIIIGNFDGVHLGHQALLGKARSIAQDLGKPLGVLTFEPNPKQLFHPDEPPSRLTMRNFKAEKLAEYGVDYIFSLPFDWDFASQSAEAFVQNILLDGLKASHVIVGYNFKFGQLRKGNADTIREAGLPISVIDEVNALGITANPTNNLKGSGYVKYSSSSIRHLLRHGKISEANAILGWEWEIRGRVFKGDQRGRELGYPTANMPLDDIVHPAYGIYACMARIKDENEWMPAVCNIGIRPMFEVKTAQVETFIFDFNREIYGKTLCVRPIKRLRGEAKFDSLDELIKQIDQDCAQAKEVLREFT